MDHPCQDLTFAGPYKGLLAGTLAVTYVVRLIFRLLVHHFSRYSNYVVLKAVRFLAENAASMLEMHYRAFCKLLNIDSDVTLTSTLWNPSDFGYQITRRRNFFRNFDDVEEIPLSGIGFRRPLWSTFKAEWGNDPTCPLCWRTRDTLP